MSGRKMDRRAFDGPARFYDAFMCLFGLYHVEEIVEMLALNGDEVLLDLGGGTGYMASRLLPLAGEVHLLDESSEMLGRVSSFSIRVVQGDALATPYEDATFDVVLLSDVYHHVSDGAKLLAEVARILRPKGHVLIHDFDRSRPIARILELLENRLFGPLRYPTIKEIDEEFLRRGFQRVGEHTKGYWFLSLWEKP